VTFGAFVEDQWKALDLDGGALTVRESVFEGKFQPPKTRKALRTIPLGRHAVGALRAHRERVSRRAGTDLVFGNRNGDPMRESKLLTNVLQPAAAATGLGRVTWHQFRHIHSSLLNDLRVPARIAQEQLAPEELALLRAIAGFRLPAAYQTLAALLARTDQPNRPFEAEDTLDLALADLEDRGHLGWDRRANRYDLHPIVRGVVWSGAGDGGPRADRGKNARSVRGDAVSRRGRPEDLTPAIELYVSLIRRDCFEEALHVFVTRGISYAVCRLGRLREGVELLEMLFPDGLHQLPRLQQAGDQASALDVLGNVFCDSGRPARAVQ
jgi:hypothetical protein